MKKFYLHLIIFGVSFASLGVAKMSDKNDLKKKLSTLEYEVTQNEGTEPPFQNKYWDHKEPGIYVDVVSGEPLFSSLDKYDSGSGWPAFTKPIDKTLIKTKTDTKLFIPRTEIRSSNSDSHLGHVFDDGPKDKGGMRYCVNSASLKFIHKNDLEKEGYGEYKKLFQNMSEDKNMSKDVAYFGGGCFWGVEAIFSKIDGVLDVESGYAGGKTSGPTYTDIKTGTTGHAEVVKITFDSSKVSYETLLDYFWRMHDPTTVNRQGVDVGTQYRSIILYTDKDQKTQAENSKNDASKRELFEGRTIVTEIVPLDNYYKAEDYHQDYYDKKYQGGEGPICHTLRQW